MGDTGSLLPLPFSVPLWVACLPPRLFTECLTRLITSGVLDAGTSISSSFPLHPSPRRAGLLRLVVGHSWMIRKESQIIKKEVT